MLLWDVCERECVHICDGLKESECGCRSCYRPCVPMFACGVRCGSEA